MKETKKVVIKMLYTCIEEVPVDANEDYVYELVEDQAEYSNGIGYLESVWMEDLD